MSETDPGSGWLVVVLVHWPGLLFVLAVLMGVAAIGMRASRWARGRRAPVPWIAGLAAVPRRYLVDLHHVVARDRYAATMHVPTAGGFVVACVMIVIVHVLGERGDLARYILLASLVVMAAGTLLVLYRRYHFRPARLSGGAWNRLGFVLAAFIVTFALVTVDTGAVVPGLVFSGVVGFFVFVLALWVLLEMIGLAPYGPMRHAIAGALHLAWHPRPARFSGGAPDAALIPLELDDARLGVGAMKDFAWNQLLGFDVCVSCGRCEAACPAFAAGQPLTPKKFVQDLVAGMGRNADDITYPGQPYPGIPLGERINGPDDIIAGNLVPEATIWSCTTCRACVYECPMMIEHVDAMIDLRRFLTLEEGRVPGHGPDVLEETRLTDNPGGHAMTSRLDWASDLDLKIARDDETFDWLLWLGDGAFELRNQRTLRALVKLLRRADVDFAVLGETERDCGDLSRRLGDEATFQRLAHDNIQAMDRLGVRRIVTADPHVLHCLKNEYPAFGGRYQVLHHTQLLADLVRDKRLEPRRETGGSVTYHDPCYLGRYNGETSAPRDLIDALGLERREMARSGLRSFCCGGGGGAPVTDVPGKARIPDLRMDQARATGAERVAVACPNCMQMLEGVVAPRPEVIDVAEMLLEAVGP